LKYILVGDTYTGKSSLVHSFNNNSLPFQCQATIGVEFNSKIIQLKDYFVKVLIWDTAGLERFRSITKSYYKRCSIAIIVYDVTEKETFKNLEYWYKQLVDNCDKETLIVVVGNKSDKKNRDVSYDEGYAFAEKYDLLFFETSIYDKNKIRNVFEESASLFIRNNSDLVIENNIEIKENNKKSSTWCCWF
jgi:Ras-related protein Rab-2A